MDDSRTERVKKESRGAVKEAIGETVGEAKLETEGKIEKVEGKIQNAIGGIKNALTRD